MRAQAVHCVTTGKFYRTMRDASADYGWRASALNSKWKHIGHPNEFEFRGERWKLIDWKSIDKGLFESVTTTPKAIKPRHAQKIMDIDSGDIYSSMYQAAKALGGSETSIRIRWITLGKPDRFTSLDHTWITGKSLDAYLAGCTDEAKDEITSRSVYNLTTHTGYVDLEAASRDAGVSVHEIVEAIFYKKPVKGCIWSRHPS